MVAVFLYEGSEIGGRTTLYTMLYQPNSPGICAKTTVSDHEVAFLVFDGTDLLCASSISAAVVKQNRLSFSISLDRYYEL